MKTNLTPNKMRILEKLMENPNGMKLREIAKMNGEWEEDNIDDISELVIEGYVVFNENGYYKIMKEED